MSKKKKNQQKQESFSQSIATLTANGQKAFRQNDFEKAILSWEKIPAKLRPAAMLAEAHFRRGLELFYRPDSAQMGMEHLKTAAAYQPNDPCYTYHVGLALHRLGDVAGALAAYQTAHKSPGPFATRAAYPLALALLQSGQDPTAAPIWNILTPAEQSMLRSANAFRRRPYNPPTESPLLWRTLAALDSGESAQAQAGLEQVLAGDASATEKGVAHFYRGALAARAEDWESAQRNWESAHVAGLRSSRLSGNLAETYQRLAEDLLVRGDANTARAAAEEAKRHRPEDTALDELLAHIHQQIGYQAASANRWDEAQSHWQTAVKLDSAGFRLAYNLALSYEKSDNYLLAGETWREALRRRPRRADHPDALSDEQVARLWQRAAECYRRAGEFDEMGRTYQQAIKWAPENLNLRLSLAESLIADGRLQAARNELERIIERDPKHIQALLRLGEAYFRDEDSPWHVKGTAKRCWEKVLQIEPKNAQARQLLGEWYIDRAEIAYSWSRYAEAIENYQKSLEFQPNKIETLAYLAKCHFRLKNEAKGEEFAQQALSKAANFDDFAHIIEMWLDIGYDQRAWELIVKAEVRFEKVPLDFYIFTARNLIKKKRKTEASRWLQRAIEKAIPEEHVLIEIGESLMDIDAPLALEYLQKALDVGQMPGHAHLLMGILEDRQGNPRASKKHLSEAERIASKTKDTELARRAEMARITSGGPDEMVRRLMDLGGPGLVEKFLEDFEGFEEEFN